MAKSSTALCIRTSFLPAALAMAVWGTSAAAQNASLAADAEYNGALLAAGAITFQPDGSVAKAILKTDYVRDGLTYKAGTNIEFASDGRVLLGQLATAVPHPGNPDHLLQPGIIRFHQNGGIHTATLKAGSRDKNITLPVDMVVEFTLDGRFIQMKPAGIAGLQYSFGGRTLRNGYMVSFVYDRIKGSYLMTRGAVGAPQMIGVLVTARDASQQPSAAAPVVVPATSTFNLMSQNIDNAADQSATDEWYYEGTFAINGYNFGLRPRLKIRGNTLVGVSLGQGMTIDGVAYPIGAAILLNDVGKIVK